MVIDWGRNVLGWKDADSTEFNKQSKYPVVSLLEEQTGDESRSKGRLGMFVSIAEQDTKFFKAYGEKRICERHRHRYEFSNRYREEMIQSGLVIGAVNAEKDLVECVEWPGAGTHNHPWGLGVQFHPEFKSKPTAASPLFRDFVAVCRDLKAAGK